MLIRRERSQLLVVDVQERLLPAMLPGHDIVGRIALLLRAAGHLDVPVSISEQYRKGLGPTDAGLRSATNTAEVFEKIEFSCNRNPAMAGAFAAHRDAGRDQVVVTGIEAHVCVGQTALDLAGDGYEVFVVADAVASRRASDREAALARFRAAGVGVVTSEMVAFEWMERAGTDAFKAVSPLIKPL